MTNPETQPSSDDNRRDLRNVGGTPGGLPLFILGFCMAVAGGYLLTNQVSVQGGYFTFGHLDYGTSFGLTLVPMLIGVFWLFANGRSFIGWLLVIGGAVMILAGILMSLQIHFRATTLYNTIGMLVLLFGGLGLIFRAVRPMRRS